ncbi:MAG: hypothetical protein M1269_02430 [Chloroflexi bacterium]|nr:hypothetical protein [Chloroflexota bacterium]
MTGKKAAFFFPIVILILMLAGAVQAGAEAISLKKENINADSGIKVFEIFSASSSYNSVTYPTWTPGSESLIFQVLDGTAAASSTDPYAGLSLKIYSLKDRKISPVLLFRQPYYPYFKPGGGGIAFIDETGTLCLAKKGGVKENVITQENLKKMLGADYDKSKIRVTSPEWSSDGSSISFRVLADSKEAGARSQLWIYNVDQNKMSLAGIETSPVKNPFTWIGPDMVSYITPAESKKFPDKIYKLTLPDITTMPLTDENWMLWLRDGASPNTIPPFYPGDQLPEIGGERTTPPRFSEISSAKNMVYFINTYRSMRLNELVFKDSKDLWCIDIETKLQKEIIRDIETYAVSSKGEIALWKYEQDGKSSLSLMPAYNMPPVELIKIDRGVVREMKWSPDGRKLALAFDDYTDAWIIIVLMPEILG